MEYSFFGYVECQHQHGGIHCRDEYVFFAYFSFQIAHGCPNVLMILAGHGEVASVSNLVLFDSWFLTTVLYRDQFIVNGSLSISIIES